MAHREVRGGSSDCRVCGGSARASFFEVIICQSCKTRFESKILSCLEMLDSRCQGLCEMHQEARYLCDSCRSQQDFQCWANAEKSGAPKQRTKKRLSTTNEEIRQLKRVIAKHVSVQIPTLSLLRNDRSTLTSHQWTLISNILHSYQEENLSSAAQRLIDVHNTSEIDQNLLKALAHKFIAAIYDTAGAFIRCNTDLNQLRSDDRSIVVRSAVDKVASIGGCVVLFQWDLFSLPHFSRTIEEIYGKTSFNMTRWTLRFCSPDALMMKLAMGLFSVSDNVITDPEDPFVAFHDPLAVRTIQNQYVEVMWKYLCYRYGEKQAAKEFFKLAYYFMVITSLTVHLQDVSRHMTDVEATVEQTEITLIVDDVDQMMTE